MKKYIKAQSILIVLILILALTSCGKSESSDRIFTSDNVEGSIENNNSGNELSSDNDDTSDKKLSSDKYNTSDNVENKLSDNAEENQDEEKNSKNEAATENETHIEDSDSSVKEEDAETQKEAASEINQEDLDNSAQEKNNENQNKSGAETKEEAPDNSNSDNSTQENKDQQNSDNSDQHESNDDTNQKGSNEDQTKDSEDNQKETTNKQETEKDNSTDSSNESISPETTARAAFIMSSNPYVDEATAIKYVELFEKYASQRDYIDTELLMAIARIESVYDHNAIASDGSGRYLGLMQLHEYYESYYGYETDQLFDPECNIECACKLLDDCRAYYGNNTVYIIQAYHLGPIAVDNQIAAGELNTYYYDLALGFANEIKSKY